MPIDWRVSDSANPWREVRGLLKELAAIELGLLPDAGNLGSSLFRVGNRGGRQPGCLLRLILLFVPPAEPILPFSNHSLCRKHFLRVFLHFFLLRDISFVQPRRRLSSAPTTSRCSRRAQGMSRLAALQRPPRRLQPGPGLYMTEHDGKLVGLGRNAPPSVRVLPSAIADLCRLHRSLRGRGALAASWTFESFSAAMSRTGSPRCPERDHRGVAGRITRSPRPVPAGTMFARMAKGDCVMQPARPVSAIGTVAGSSTSDAE